MISGALFISNSSFYFQLLASDGTGGISRPNQPESETFQSQRRVSRRMEKVVFVNTILFLCTNYEHNLLKNNFLKN